MLETYPQLIWITQWILNFIMISTMKSKQYSSRLVCIKDFDQSKLNNLRCYVPQSLCSFVAKARVKCQFQWLHFLSPNFSFFLITQQSTQWMQRKIACQNYTQKMDSIANSSRNTGAWLKVEYWIPTYFSGLFSLLKDTQKLLVFTCFM